MKILKKITSLVFKVRLYFSNGYNRAYIYSRYLGICIGENIRITGYVNFGSEPYLITLGKDITITNNVTFHTHDGGLWVFRKKFPGINLYKKIVVGNNVFIGYNVQIMPGVTIGDNVVIGAGAVVTKDLEPNGVYVGIPAKRIKSIDEYYAKVKNDVIFISKTDNKKEKILESINENRK